MVEPKHANRVILASGREMELLACNINEPLFAIEKLVLDEKRDPIHRSTLVTPANRVSFTISD